MTTSDRRILVSHTGNLPPVPMLEGGGVGDDGTPLRVWLPEAIDEVVDHQLSLGVDIVNDGEYPRGGGLPAYIAGRLDGFSTREGDEARPPKRPVSGERDRLDFPGFYESGLWFSGAAGGRRPGFATPGGPPAWARGVELVCTGPISYMGHEHAAEEIALLQSAIVGKRTTGFLTVPGPLSLGAPWRNEHYTNDEDYLVALAEALREEYRAITGAGILLQLDEPDLATTWMLYPEWSVDDYRRYLEFGVEVINHALEGLPEDLVRLHVCWGSGHRPHVNDIELRHIVDIVLKVRAGCYAIESANVRHDHDYHVWEDVQLPEGKILMPGVVGHATDLVEHPELVAERLLRYAERVGPESVQAGTDCGIGMRVGHAEIAWAKLEALSAGARIASMRLWGQDEETAGG